ncbi:hypothetical protein HDU76_002917 [Blyttiomyces sp. JEL0837]|nr:hypothetical protein HDU76_002917 [Blyttiomyces sp. JEL0837]
MPPKASSSISSLSKKPKSNDHETYYIDAMVPQTIPAKAATKVNKTQTESITNIYPGPSPINPKPMIRQTSAGSGSSPSVSRSGSTLTTLNFGGKGPPTPANHVAGSGSLAFVDSRLNQVEQSVQLAGGATATAMGLGKLPRSARRAGRNGRFIGQGSLSGISAPILEAVGEEGTKTSDVKDWEDFLQNRDEMNLTLDIYEMDTYLLAISLADFQGDVFVRSINIMIIVINVLVVVYRPQNFTTFQLILLDVLAFSRYLIIAAKYAYTSPIEYVELNNVKVDKNINSRRQVLTSWNYPDKTLRESQLLLAGVRHGICIIAATFDMTPVGRTINPTTQTQQPIDATKSTTEGGKESAKTVILASSNVNTSDTDHKKAGTVNVELSRPSITKVPLPKLGELPQYNTGLSRQVSPIEVAQPPSYRKNSAMSPFHLMQMGISPVDTVCKNNKTLNLNLNLNSQFNLVNPQTESPPTQELKLLQDLHNDRLANTTDISRLSLCDTAMTLLAEAQELYVDLRWMFLIGVLHALVPLISILIDNGTGKRSIFDRSTQLFIVDWFIYAMSTFASFFLMSTNVGFLIAGITDFKRREYLLRRLNFILDEGHIRAPSYLENGEIDDRPETLEFAPILRIPMTKPRNIIIWWHLRACLQDWGRPFLKRILLYTGLFMLYVMAILLLLFIQIFSSAESPSIETDLILYACLHGLFMGGLLSSVLLSVDKYNSHRVASLSMLQKKKLALEMDYDTLCRQETTFLQKRNLSHVSDLPLSIQTEINFQKQAIRDSIQAIDIVNQAIEVDNKTNSIKILGFEAGSQMLEVLGALAGIGASVALKKYF